MPSITLSEQTLDKIWKYLPWATLIIVIGLASFLQYSTWNYQTILKNETRTNDKAKTEFFLGELSHSCAVMADLHNDIETYCKKFEFNTTGKTPEEKQAMLDKYPTECSSTKFVFNLLEMNCSDQVCDVGNNIPPYCSYVQGVVPPSWDLNQWTSFSTVK
jgi:hypothetical protein